MTEISIEDLLHYDGLAEAERLTGKSYREDPATQAFGFALSMMNDDTKRKALAKAGDTHFGMSFWDALAVYVDLGFEVVHRRRFPGRVWQGETEAPEETYLLLWRPDGLLATLESHRGSVNSAKILYNVEIRQDAAEIWQYTSSGHIHTPSYDAGRRVWAGHHDTREGLRSKIAGLEKIGEFLPEWKERPFLWFLPYTESDSPNRPYKQIAEQIISELPEHVRNAVTPEETA